MRIFLTGVTGLLGRAMARQLIAAGHAVTGIAAYPHLNLHPDVDFVCASLGDPVLEQLAGAADVVLHLAPIETAVPGSAGINGLVRVAHAAARAGARLIYVSVSAGQPTLYRQAETLVSSGWAPSLVVRVAPPMGRQLDWMICRTIGSLLHGKAFGLVDGRETLFILEVRNVHDTAGLAVVAPAVIAALNPAFLADAAERQRGAPMRTAVLQGADLPFKVAPQHHGPIADIHR